MIWAVDDVAHFTTGHNRTQLYRIIFVSLVYYLLSKDQLIRTYLSLRQLLLCRVAAVRRFFVLFIVQVMFSGSLGSQNSFTVILKIKFCLSPR